MSQKTNDHVWGLGTDIIEIERIKNAIHRRPKFLHSIFTAQEIAYCQQFQNPYGHFAGRFAAKEAIAKALKTGIGPALSWLDIEILSTPAPQAFLSPRILSTLPPLSLHLSISHSKHYAIATCLITR